MAKCEICNKKKTIVKCGRHRQTVNVARRGSMGLRGHKSPKKIEPNVRKVKIMIPAPKADKRAKSADKSKKTVAKTTKTVSVKMCMACYKKYRVNQGFKAKVLASLC